MLGLSILPPEIPIIRNDEVTKDLNRSYPNAIDGDAVMFLGPDDGVELWVKYGSQWTPGWAPGSGPGMTMEARPDYKRIIADLTDVWATGGRSSVVKTGVTTSTGGINTGNLALIGLLGLLLLRGALK